SVKESKSTARGGRSGGLRVQCFLSQEFSRFAGAAPHVKVGGADSTRGGAETRRRRDAEALPAGRSWFEVSVDYIYISTHCLLKDLTPPTLPPRLCVSAF